MLTLSYQNDKNVLITIRKGMYRHNVGINAKSYLILVGFFYSMDSVYFNARLAYKL